MQAGNLKVCLPGGLPVPFLVTVLAVFRLNSAVEKQMALLFCYLCSKQQWTCGSTCVLTLPCCSVWAGGRGVGTHAAMD